MRNLKAGVLSFGLCLLATVASANVNKSINLGDNVETGGESTVNGSISVGSNSTINGSLDSVNGSIKVGEGTRLGDAQTVNGSIRLGDEVMVDDVESVNGTIRLGENVAVDGEISVVNGKIQLGAGTQVEDTVSNVNGQIELTNAVVGGDVSTVTGDVSLLDRSTIEGDLIVEKPGGFGWFKERRKPKIIIGPGSRVAGKIDLEWEVELFISDTAEVGGVVGEMSMDDAIRFSGERP